MRAATGEHGWGRTMVRKVLVVAGVVTLGATLSGCTPAQPTVLRSRWETFTGGDLRRDGGYSAPLPDLPGLSGQSLWIWGDTAVNGGYVPGTFASIGPSTVSPFPEVSEIPTPGITGSGPSILPPAPPNPPNPIAHFLPNPEGLRLPGNAQPCGGSDPAQGIDSSLPVRWPHGVARGPGGGAQINIGGTLHTAANLMVIAYTDVCLLFDEVDGGPAIWTVAVERFGLAVYRPADNRLLTVSTVFGHPADGSDIPWQQWLFHPTFHGTDVFFYAVCNPEIELADACPDPVGKVAMARVPLANLLTGSAYQWRTATGWSSTPSQAVTIVPVDAGSPPWSVYVGDFRNVGRGWLLVEGVSGDGDVRIYQASAPTGPWTLRLSGKMPGCPESPAPNLVCYHLWGHPELSTTDDQIFSHNAVVNPPQAGETFVLSLGNHIPPLP